jgi:hypothetical protein
VHLLPTSTKAPGGHVTGGEVKTYDANWNQLSTGEIAGGKLIVNK